MTDLARTQLSLWTSSVLDGWQNDPAVDAKDSRSCLSLVGAEPVAFARTLAAGGAFAFEAGADPGVDKGWLRVALPTPELDRRLTLMRRAARRALVDRGEQLLWIALGMLVWHERTSPLALMPVELERSASGGLRLVAAESAAVRINPALIGALERELAMVPELPGTAGTLAVAELSALFDAADGIALTRPGWRVERSAKLGVFSLSRHAIAAELSARTDELLAHPIVGHLAAAAAGAPRPFAQPSVAAAEAVTRPAPSTDVLAPLDADASQLAAIAAAAAGATFVVQAPPGTGASQTIANLAVHLGAHGKRVLVVSDKAAALDTIVQRLAAIGLGELCLPLYGLAAERSRVLGQLERVVERAFRPGAGPSSASTVDARLGELRAALDAHVAELHRVGPFGRSLHQVLGRLVELRSAPNADLAERDAVGLDAATFERRLAAVERLATAALPVEPVATHPWRTSALDMFTVPGVVVDAATADRTKATALEALDDAAAAVEQLAACVKEIGLSVPGLTASTREQLTSLGALAVIAAASPRPGAEMLTNLRLLADEDLDEVVALIRARGTGSVEVPKDPLAFLALAHKHRALASEVDEVFSDAVEQLDAPALWAQLRKWTNSVGPLRYVTLRAVRAEVKAAALAGRLETDAAMISGLEAVIAERATRAALLAAAEPAMRWFGELGGDPLALDLAKLDDAIAWSAELRKAFDAVHIAGGDAARATVWRALVAQVAAGIPLPAAWASATEPNAFARLADAVARWSPALSALSRATGIPSEQLASGDDHLQSLADRIAALRQAIDALPAWTAFHAARHAARTAGIDAAVTAIERGDLGAAELAAAWERATLLAWADAELAEAPTLSQFHGASHHAQVAAFADLDRGALALARARAAVKLAELAPRASKDPTGEIAILLAEANGTPSAQGRTVRATLAAMPTTLGKIAPCILATPAAVAELLDPSLPPFDLVVIDEASRLTTPSVLGALARGSAAVIVGDRARNQPTAHALLDVAETARLPELSLAWHYRSKHEDLIAYANERAYGSRLHVLPAAASGPELGVGLRSVESATFDRETLTNQREAEALVADVLARLNDPAQRTRSIGIVAFTAAQRELIEDLLDAAREGDPALDAAIEPGPDATFEPLLVTDLVHATGDERDVILISTVFAEAIDRGPLTAANGDRVLWGALSCAREQLLVFSSLDHTTLLADTEGLRELVALLAFAGRGGGALKRTLDETTPAPGPASPITEAMARALAERGWTLRHQVGVGPYTLDLAVVDPTDPERFVLAIEHDGAAYASAPHARDRDRLRPAVLAQLGWRLHRVWGLDWWIDAEREIQRAHGAIVTAIAAHRAARLGRAPVTKAPRLARASIQPPISAAAGSAPVSSIASRPRTASGSAPIVKARADRSAPASARTAPTGVPTTTTRTESGGTDAVLASGSGPASAPTLAAYDGPTTPVRLQRGAIAIGPYTAAAIPSGRRTPNDLFAPRYLGEVGKIIDQVLAAEAPMHIDLLARRVGGYFGIGRLSARVVDQVRVALEGRGKFGDEDQIVWRLDQDPSSVPPVRVAGSHATAKRAIEEVPLSELASAARIVVERAAGITTSELVRDSARLLGFARMTDQVTERVTLGVRLAIARELVRVSDENKVRLPD